MGGVGGTEGDPIAVLVVLDDFRDGFAVGVGDGSSSVKRWLFERSTLTAKELRLKFV